MKEQGLDYVVFENLEVELINSKIETNSNPLFFIKSYFIKKSGGQRLYSYYRNAFFDSNHKLIENNKLVFNDIICSIEEAEKWKAINGNHHDVVLTTTIKDKLGLELPKIFPSGGYKPQDRFKRLFLYIKLLQEAGTHASCQIIEKKDLEISKLEKRIEHLKSKAI